MYIFSFDFSGIGPLCPPSLYVEDSLQLLKSSLMLIGMVLPANYTVPIPMDLRSRIASVVPSTYCGSYAQTIVIKMIVKEEVTPNSDTFWQLAKTSSADLHAMIENKEYLTGIRVSEHMYVFLKSKQCSDFLRPTSPPQNPNTSGRKIC